MSNEKRIRYRAAAGCLIAGLGILHSLYYVAGMLTGWEIDGWNVLQAGAGLAFAGLGFGIYVWRKKKFSGGAVLWLRAIQAGIVLGLLLYASVETLIWLGGRPTELRQTDYLLILGARVRGETISLSLKDRLDRGIEYLDRYPDAAVILSGGRGPGENVSEAEAMKRYLKDHGIAEARIMTEDRSTSTYENVMFTRDMLESSGISVQDKTFTVVTNSYHLYRAKELARKAGLQAYGLPAPAPPFTLPKSYTREFAAVLKMWATGR